MVNKYLKEQRAINFTVYYRRLYTGLRTKDGPDGGRG